MHFQILFFDKPFFLCDREEVAEFQADSKIIPALVYPVQVLFLPKNPSKWEFINL
jgi:hypothetical protein